MTRLVVAAALVDDLERPTRVLAARRARPAALRGRWEFPGGKVEPEEDVRAALARELREELFVAAEIGAEIVAPAAYANSSGCWPINEALQMRAFWAVADGVPRPGADHDEIVWLVPERLSEPAWLPADVALARWIGEHWPGE